MFVHEIYLLRDARGIGCRLQFALQDSIGIDYTETSIATLMCPGFSFHTYSMM